MTATVTAKKNGKKSSFKLVRNIKVKKPSAVLDNRVLTVGDITFVGLENEPSGTEVSYYSTNSEKVSVTGDGTVKAITAGAATVKARVVLPKTKYAKKTTLTLSAGTVVVRGINASVSSGTPAPAQTAVPQASSSGTPYSYTASPGMTAVPSASSYATQTPAATAATAAPTASVNPVKTVNTQLELDVELWTNESKTVTIGKNATSLEIKAGNYDKIDLVVDAPNATIINNGNFHSVKIYSIANHTWYEKGANNIIDVYNSYPVHLIIDTLSSLSSLIFYGNASGESTVDVKGTSAVDLIQIRSKEKVNINTEDNAKVAGIGVAAAGTVDINTKGSSEVGTVSVSATGADVDVTASGESRIGIVEATKAAGGLTFAKTALDIRAEGSAVIDTVKNEAANIPASVNILDSATVSLLKIIGYAQAIIEGTSKNPTNVDVKEAANTTKVAVRTAYVAILALAIQKANDIINNQTGKDLVVTLTNANGETIQSKIDQDEKKTQTAPEIASVASKATKDFLGFTVTLSKAPAVNTIQYALEGTTEAAWRDWPANSTQTSLDIPAAEGSHMVYVRLKATLEADASPASTGKQVLVALGENTITVTSRDLDSDGKADTIALGSTRSIAYEDLSKELTAIKATDTAGSAASALAVTWSVDSTVSGNKAILLASTKLPSTAGTYVGTITAAASVGYKAATFTFKLQVAEAVAATATPAVSASPAVTATPTPAVTPTPIPTATPTPKPTATPTPVAEKTKADFEAKYKAEDYLVNATAYKAAADTVTNTATYDAAEAAVKKLKTDEAIGTAIKAAIKAAIKDVITKAEVTLYDEKTAGNTAKAVKKLITDSTNGVAKTDSAKLADADVVIIETKDEGTTAPEKAGVIYLSWAATEDSYTMRIMVSTGTDAGALKLLETSTDIKVLTPLAAPTTVGAATLDTTGKVTFATFVPANEGHHVSAYTISLYEDDTLVAEAKNVKKEDMTSASSTSPVGIALSLKGTNSWKAKLGDDNIYTAKVRAISDDKSQYSDSDEKAAESVKNNIVVYRGLAISALKCNSDTKDIIQMTDIGVVFGDLSRLIPEGEAIELGYRTSENGDVTPMTMNVNAAMRTDSYDTINASVMQGCIITSTQKGLVNNTLEPDTTYWFVARVAESASHAAGPWSVGLEEKTLKSIIVTTKDSSGNTLKTYSGKDLVDNLIYKYIADPTVQQKYYDAIFTAQYADVVHNGNKIDNEVPIDKIDGYLKGTVAINAENPQVKLELYEGFYDYEGKTYWVETSGNGLTIDGSGAGYTNKAYLYAGEEYYPLEISLHITVR